MSKIKEYLSDLPEEKRILFAPVFGTVEQFYMVAYLIAMNEHITDMEKPDQYEQRLETIKHIRRQLELLADSYGLDGKEVMADISSDYFEDYVNYREPEIEISNDEFLRILRDINTGKS